VVWRNPLTPKFIGDMPHTWVGSDFIRSVLDMFAYEREADSALVIAAGIPETWAREAGGVSISNLSTHYGPLSYAILSTAAGIEIRITSRTTVPKGGLIIRSPAPRPVDALVNGSAASLRNEEVVVRSLPAVVTFRYSR
jgi:hypothetical protein